jgi:hypothetical protein
MDRASEALSRKKKPKYTHTIEPTNWNRELADEKYVKCRSSSQCLTQTDIAACEVYR